MKEAAQWLGHSQSVLSILSLLFFNLGLAHPTFLLNMS